MVRQEDGQGDVGWGRAWTKVRYRSLNEKPPEAVLAFEAELRREMEEEQNRKEILERYRHPYIEELEGGPESQFKDSYLRDLKRLGDKMVHSKTLGYGGFTVSMIYEKLKDMYPNAHVVIEEELEHG